jgi:hypothetical protein
LHPTASVIVQQGRVGVLLETVVASRRGLAATRSQAVAHLLKSTVESNNIQLSHPLANGCCVRIWPVFQRNDAAHEQAASLLLVTAANRSPLKRLVDWFQKFARLLVERKTFRLA